MLRNVLRSKVSPISKLPGSAEELAWDAGTWRMLRDVLRGWISPVSKAPGSAEELTWDAGNWRMQKVSLTM